MGDSAETSPPLVESVSLYTNPNNSRSPTQTLDRDSSYRRSKVDAHASARLAFDKIAQEDKSEDFKLSESKHEEDMNPRMSTEVLEDSDEPLLSPSGAEVNGPSEPFNHLVVDDNANDPDDETDEWISCNRSQTEEYKPSSSSWYEDVYEKPSMVAHSLANNPCHWKLLEDMVGVLHVQLVVSDRSFCCTFYLQLSCSIIRYLFSYAKALEGQTTLKYTGCTFGY